MKKHILLVIIMIINVIQLSAQKSSDVLYLKNGNMLYGKLIEITNDQYKMQTSDGSIFIYKADEVEKFAKESPFFEGRKTRGFGFALEVGFLIGSQESDYVAPLSFNFLAGLTSNTNNVISLGSGVEFIGRPYTPLFLEYKYIINNRKTSPFIFFRGGGLVVSRNDEESSSNPSYQTTQPKHYKGGFSMAIGTGISWAKEGYETNLSFAYRFAHTSYTQNEYSRGNVTYDNKLNRLEIKYGFKF